jgi:Kef-type K+ transport system membrane component KefB
MKKILGITAIVFIAAMITYAIRTNGFDVVILLGTLMIVSALVIVLRILTARTQKQNQLN